MADDGVVAKFLLPEGASDIPVGTPMVVLVNDVADVAAFANFEAAAEAAPEPAAASAAPVAPAAAAVPPPPPPPSAAAAAPAIAGVAAPTVGGRIYYNETQGESQAAREGEQARVLAILRAHAATIAHAMESTIAYSADSLADLCLPSSASSSLTSPTTS